MKLTIKDSLAVLFCSAGIITSLLFFYRDLNKTFSKVNEVPVATVTYRYRMAQRKFSDRMVWDYLQNNASVYDGDTIRTADLSEATIHFSDGSLLNMDGNTLVQVFIRKAVNAGKKKRNRTVLEVSSGNVKVTAGTGKVPMTVKTKKTAVELDSGSAAAVSVTEKGVQVQAVKGTAAVYGVSQSKSLNAGETAVVENSGEKIQLSEISVLRPIQGETYIQTGKEAYPVVFQWKITDNPGVLNIAFAKDSEFTDVISKQVLPKGNESQYKLPAGSYYWRIASDTKDISAASGMFTVINVEHPQLIMPAQNAEFKADAETNGSTVDFSWALLEQASSYKVIVSQTRNMEKPIATAETQVSYCSIHIPEAGSWYWQVIPSVKDVQVNKAASSVASFIVTKPEIKTTVPSDENTLETEESKSAETVAETEPSSSEPEEVPVQEPSEETKTDETVEETNVKDASAVSFEEELVVTPKTAAKTTVSENAASASVSTESGSETEKTTTQPAKKEESLSVTDFGSEDVSAPVGKELIETDFSPVYLWRTWDDSKVGGQSDSSIQSVRIDYGDKSYSGIKFLGTIRNSSGANSGISLYMNNLSIPVSLTSSNSLRFKVVGDGSVYTCRLGVASTEYGCRIQTEKDTVLQFDIPFTMFRQQSGHFLKRLDPAEITGLSFAPVNAHSGDYSLVIFDMASY